MDFDPFCVFLCFKVRYFVFEKHRKFYLSSEIFLTSLHWNMATGTFPLTFIFADKHSGCYTYGNGLIDVAEKFEFGACSIWIVEYVGRGSFLFPTLISRKIEGDSVRRASVNRHHTHRQNAKGLQAEKYGGRGKSEFKLIKDHNNLLCVTEQQR